jgi:hypothetical protein
VRASDATPVRSSDPVIPNSTRPGRTWQDVPSQRAVGWLVFVGLVAVAVVRNRWIFSQGRVEDGDFAVNSILIDEARHFRLLVGNYSRVGFHHPGPALLYVQAFSQLLFHDLVPILPRPYNAHVFGIVVLDAGLVACAASIAVRATGRRTAGLAVGVLALVLAWTQPGVLVSTWFPDVYVWPFLLLAVSAAAVLSGARRELPYLALALCLLVHGHVSFVLFCGVVVAAVIATERVQRRRGVALERLSGRRRAATTGIVALFALPIVVNLLLHWPGELSKYWRYSRDNQSSGRTLADALAFVSRYWAPGRMGAIVSAGLVAGALCAAAATAARARGFLVSLVVTSVGLAGVGVVYAYRGVDDLSFRYVGEFLIVTPALVVLAAVVAALDRHAGSATRRVAMAIVVAIVGAAALFSPGQAARYSGANWIVEAREAVVASRSDGSLFAVTFPNPQWPAAAGIVEDARRDGDSICVADPGYEFLFSDVATCDSAQRAAAVPVVVLASPPAADGPAPTGTKVYDAHGITVFVGG